MNEFDIEFRQVSKRFGDLNAVDNISFSVPKGAFHSFLGASGCGKTTTLRMIAGFEQASCGEVFIDGEPMNGIPAFERPVNMVFQHYALFPHMNVAANVGYGLAYHKPKLSKAELDKRVDEALEMVRMGQFKTRRIWELSGGQQQRVALARALVNKPKVLLLDEPLAALDRKLRKEMQTELLRLQREVGITFVMVTHDQEEALSLSDQISVMKDGRIIQTASPRELYDHPGSAYVADFIGESNLFFGELQAIDGNTLTVKTPKGVLLAGRSSEGASALTPGAECCISVRPDHIRLSKPSGQPQELAKVIDQIFLGNLTEYQLASERHGTLTVRLHEGSDQAPLDHGELVALEWAADKAVALPL